MTEPLTPLQRLYELAPRGSLLGLDRVRKAAEQLDNVHQVGTYVHIAGTNGKGSTAAMLSAMARAAGAKVGMFTSPHLCKFSERIQIDGRPISDELLDQCLERVLDLDAELTFFEVATLTALLAFRESGVNLWILEVGLGGRLDATNIVEGKGVPVITRVAFDHVKQLGRSLKLIAAEKAGILRKDAVCVVGRLHPDALDVVKAKCEEQDAFLYEATSEEESLLVDQHPPALAGTFQRGNAMVAVAVAKNLGIPPASIAQGLAEVRWPGRFEIVETPDGYIVLDCAHNADGALSLKNALMSLGTGFPRRQIAIIFGSMADKNWKAMVDRFTSISAWLIYSEPQGREPANAEEMMDYVKGEVIADVGEALTQARERVGRNGLVVVAGSVYLVGAARAFLLGQTCDPHLGM